MLTRVVTPHRIAYTLLLAVAIGFIVVAVSNGRPNPTRIADANPAIDALVPTPGSEILRQSQVGIDLAPGYTAQLVINGVAVPPEEIVGDPSLAQFFFLPRPDGPIELRPGENCVSATYWRIAEGPERARTESWCFQVL